MAEQQTAVEIARRLADICEDRGVPYAIGGALALGFYAVPRATVDVDLNIFLPPASAFSQVLSLLAEAGLKGSRDDDALLAQALAVRETLVRLVGGDDERIRALVQIEADVDSA